MARSQAGATLTEQHRDRQLALRAGTTRQFMALWPAWDPADPASWGPFVQATATLVDVRRRDSAGLASNYYRSYRFAEQAPGEATVRLAPPVRPETLRSSLEVTARAQAARSLGAGLPPQQARATALVTTTGAVTRHVLNGGRETLIGSVGADRQARGWQRVTAGNPCAFCVMLSSRGPVYRADTADFQAHDHCACAVEPVYPGGEWNSRNRAHRDLWNEHASGQPDPLNALRRALA